jgi:hypothetical protein
MRARGKELVEKARADSIARKEAIRRARGEATAARAAAATAAATPQRSNAA